MMDKNADNLTVTVEEAGRMLGISRGLAYRMCREGRLPAIRLGQRLVVSRPALERLLAGDGVSAP